MSNLQYNNQRSKENNNFFRFWKEQTSMKLEYQEHDLFSSSKKDIWRCYNQTNTCGVPSQIKALKEIVGDLLHMLSRSIKNTNLYKKRYLGE